jgi:5-formyltetrahydrofolate cyclo-ligase
MTACGPCKIKWIIFWVNAKWSWIPLNKSELRKKIRTQINAVDEATRDKAALAAARWLAASDVFQHSEHIACYFPRGMEFNTIPIIHAIWAAKKKCYLPLLPTDDSRILNFADYKTTDNLTLNQYQIFEPDSAEFFSAPELDLVLTPVMGFDKKGNRLGSGGGYYDRTFAFVKNSEKPPVLWGVAYWFQFMDELPRDEWDVLLDGVLTERELLLFSCSN